MKNIKSISIKYHIPTFIAILFLFISCAKDEILIDPQEIDKTLFTDEDVFKGVMFLEGPVANKMSSYKDLNFRSFVSDKSQIEEIINFQNEIVNKIIYTDPDYLSNFRKKIGSGDYYLIKSTISEASLKISDIAYEISNLNRNEVSIIAKKFSYNLQHKYNIDEKSSKEDLRKAIKEMKSYKQTAKDVYPVYYYKWAAVWLAAAAAAVIIIVIVLEEVVPVDPLDPSEPFPDNTNSEKRYLIDDYQSEVTFGLKGI
ncbi:hypothetical protein [Flavobacterium sp.]|uniref:hypothetical protein n=1 Tax=Flavobacterium sp. TaxID=239 RepID=UPI0031D83265